MKRPRRNHSSAFKAKVALAVVKGDQRLAQLAERFDVHPQQITQWKAQLLEKAGDVFATAAEKRGSEGPSLKDLQAKIGQLAMENEWNGHSLVEVGAGRCNDRHSIHFRAWGSDERSQRSGSSPGY